MIVNCPHCHKTVQADASGFYRCPFCQQIFEVQVPAASAPPPDLPPPTIDSEETVSVTEPQNTEPICERCRTRVALDICGQCGVFVCETCAKRDDAGKLICLAHQPAPPPAIEPTAWEMLMGLYSKPAKTMERLDPANANLLKPLIFAMVCITVGTVFTAGYQYLFQSVLSDWLGPLFNLNSAELDGVLSKEVQLLVTVVFAPFSAVIAVMIQSLLIHLSLRIVGSGKSGLNATIQVLGYSSASSLLSVIPLVGFIAPSIYSLVLSVIGCAKIHRDSYGRVLLAHFLPMAFCCFLVFILMLLAFALVGSVAGLSEIFSGAGGGTPI